MIVHRGEGDIRHHAAVLGAVTGDPVELALGNLELAFGQGNQGLYRALAEGTVAHDDAALVVLYRAGENFRGRGAEAVDQHHQRTIVVGGLEALAVAPHAAGGVPDLHGGAVLDEQAGQFIGLLQGAAAVIAQVDHDTLDTLGLQFVQQFLHVAGGALVVLVAAAHGLEVDVEGRDVDHTHLDIVATHGHFHDFFLRCLLFELDGVAHDGHHLVLIGLGVGGDDFQAHGGILGAANQLHDFIQAPADNVLHGAFLTLAHGDNTVRGFEFTLLVRRALGHQPGYLGVLVLLLQYGAYALQRQAHIDVEVLGAARRQIVGMGIVQFGQRIGVDLEHVLAVVLLDPVQLALVTLDQGGGDFIRGLVGKFQAQHLVLEALAPAVVQFLVIRRPHPLIDLQGHGFVNAEIHIG